MKPNFTLSLSFEGITLLHRAAGGWRSVGEVPLMTPKLKDALAVLRKTAVALEPGGVRCKLLIPNDQIKYLTIDTPDLDEDARRGAALAALAGATPYAVADLAYDISPDGARTHIAAVARETLDEAEDFAAEHRFHPVSFVAAPGDEPFLGEPFFGPTAQVSDLLEPGEQVEPDGIAVVVIGTIDPSAAKQATTAPPPMADDVDGGGDAIDSDVIDNDTPAPDAEAAPLYGVSAPTIPSLEPPVQGFASRRSKEGDVKDAAAGFAEDPAPPLRQRLHISPPEPPAPRPAAVAAPARVAPVPPATSVTDARPASYKGFAPPQAEPIGGKPRHLGLMLTAALLAVLVGVAAWAALYLEEGVAGLFDRSAPVAASDPPAEPIEIVRPVLTSVDTSLTDEDSAVLDALRRPEPAAEPPVALSDDALAARYAVTGIWPLAPDVPEPPQVVSLDDLYVTSIDPISLSFDAVALPDASQARNDTVLGEVRSPVAADVRFDLDTDGLVRATPDGAISPDGVRVFAGRPPAVPPVIEREDTAPETAGLDPDPALAAFRPRPRPTGLAETNERATLGGLSRNELAELRPQLRPESEQEAALASASLFPQDADTAAAIDDAVGAALTEPPPNALSTSVRPDTRPNDFAQTVARATQPEPQPSSTAVQPTRTAAVVPQSVAPRIPSSASVAREATVRNAINLRRVNLIGVYGKPSDRRALVRMPNGRYRKVQVGDRIDGGRVSAIGDSELRYQKSGRNVVLKMPDS